MKTKKRIVYLDNAATTPTDPDVVESMLPYFTERFWNPSANYEPSYITKTLIEDSQQKISRLINCKPNEVYFTSGGSESDNWAIRGIIKPGDHIITSRIEHHAILHTCEYLESSGIEVTYIDVDSNGIVNIPQLESAIKNNTRLISVMYANNEIGTIQPIPEICDIAHHHGILVHTDATQIVGHQLLDVEKCGIDLLTSSAHKLNGPKGVGFLYIKDGIETFPLIFGGAQQNGLRAGTENVPGIIGFGKAAEIACRSWEKRYSDCVALRHYFERRLYEEIPGVIINGSGVSRLANITSASFDGIRGEALLVMLEMHGVFVSTGSACNSSSDAPSHVLMAMGLSEDEANSTIRFSLSHLTVKEDIDYVMDILPLCVAQLRSVNN